MKKYLDQGEIDQVSIFIQLIVHQRHVIEVPGTAIFFREGTW